MCIRDRVWAPSKGVGTVSNALGRSPCAEANSLSASDASSLTERGMSLADRHSETMPNALATSFSQRCSSAALCARNGLAKLLRVARWAGIGQSGDALCGGRGRGTGEIIAKTSSHLITEQSASSNSLALPAAT